MLNQTFIVNENKPEITKMTPNLPKLNILKKLVEDPF